MAIAQLSPEALEDSLGAVTSGLAVAFDTTALALALSMVLMFTQYVVDRVESSLLDALETRASQELLPRFAGWVEREAPSTVDLHETIQTIVGQLKMLADDGAKQWQTAVAEEREHWRNAATTAVSKAVTDLQKQAEELHAARWEEFTRRQTDLLESQRVGWSDLRETMVDQGSILADHGRSVERHATALAEAMTRVSEIGGLETALNRNLKALAGAKHFEETAAAITQATKLLEQRLAQLDAQDVPRGKAA